MNKCPKIGDRVRYIGGLVVGPCTGTITAIYKKDDYDPDLLDDAMEFDDDETYFAALRRARRGIAAESEWQVGLKVDVKPAKWCYGKSESFAPEVKDLRKHR
jgi:hypothetical protein